MAIDNETRRSALTDDDRFDLQYAASATERRNQPRVLVLGAAIILAASLLAVVFARGSLNKAQTNLARERSNESEIARLISLLESTDDSAETLIHDRYPKAKLAIKEATRSAGLSNVTNEPRLDSSKMGDGVERNEYSYPALKSHSIEILIQAVEKSLTAVKGLEVKDIKLTPGDKEWTMDITYSHLVKAD